MARNAQAARRSSSRFAEEKSAVSRNEATSVSRARHFRRRNRYETRPLQRICRTGSGIVPVKTMILLRAAANFGSIVIRSHWLELGFISDRVINHVRVHRSERVGPRKYAYRVRLQSPGDVDAQIASWLDEAYRLGR